MNQDLEAKVNELTSNCTQQKEELSRLASEESGSEVCKQKLCSIQGVMVFTVFSNGLKMDTKKKNRLKNIFIIKRNEGKFNNSHLSLLEKKTSKNRDTL